MPVVRFGLFVSDSSQSASRLRTHSRWNSTIFRERPQLVEAVARLCRRDRRLSPQPRSFRPDRRRLNEGPDYPRLPQATAYQEGNRMEV